MLNLLAQATSDFGDYMPTDIPTSTTADLGTATTFLAWLLPMMGILSVIAVAVYIYFALALFAIAKKTNTPNGWMAWVPIANIILAWQISKTPSWVLIIVLAAVLSAIPFLGTIISIASAAMMIYIWWKICERLGFPGWWAIMQIIFPVWLVMVGIIAWGKKGSVTA